MRQLRGKTVDSMFASHRFTMVFAVVSVACVGSTLDAGSTSQHSQDGPRVATTRATLDGLVDAITMDDSALYFTSEDSGVYRLKKSGDSKPERLATFDGEYAWGIAVDDD